MKATHVWRFYRAGGFDQVRLDTGADLAALGQLDQKLWVALGCPTRGIEIDPKTLDLIDTDKDGRLRPPEVLAATRWACACLKNPDDLLASAPALPLAAIADDTPEGKQLLAAARQVLTNLGKKDAAVLTVDDTSDLGRIFAQTLFNGDGIIPAEAAEDAATRTAITDIIACAGSDLDRSGKPGITQARLDAFFAAAQAFSDWQQKSTDDPSILPLGPATAAAGAAVSTVRNKVDDYFARCRLGAFDARALGALNREEKEYLAIAAKDLTITAAEIACFPLARIEAGRPLPLVDGLNPAWVATVARLRADAVTPLLGERTALTEAEWTRLVSALSAYDAWLAAKAGATVEKLGVPRVRELLATGIRDKVGVLIARDKALEPEANAIASLDRLIRYHRDLYRLLVNFVSFRDFYGRKDKAIFQAGTLYLDQRGCDLCLTVEDAGKHATMAGLAGACLVYCECVRKATGEKMQIVAAVTDGDSDNLMPGRNGLFYDRKGRDWDATIVRIVENPISLRQAFWAPYKKFVRMIEEQVAKRAATADAAAHAKLEGTATTIATVDKAKPAEPKKFDVGTIAALGVGLGAIATVIGGFVAGFVNLVWWQMPVALVGLMIAISTPSVIIAALKLRRRNLGPILDANGWAVNAKAKINIAFGRSLTSVAALPPGSRIDLVDPYADKKSGRNLLILAVLLAALAAVLWSHGCLNSWLPASLQSQCQASFSKQ